MKVRLLFNYFFISLVTLNVAQAATPIRMLIWWDYIDERVIEKLKRNGFELDVTAYRSNEVAVSRLMSNRDKFDIAVISNGVIDPIEKLQIIDKNALLKIREKRNYLKKIRDFSKFCIPYLWSASIFAFDPRSRKDKPQSLSDLAIWKTAGYQIGIIDDLLEVSARLKADNLEHLPENIQPGDFRSSLSEFITLKKTASYGWHGEAAIALKEAPWLEFKTSENKNIVGGDFICVLESSQSRSRLEKFVELFTDPQSTQWNVESSQYFSPYENDTKGLQPKVRALNQEILKSMKFGKTSFISAPSPESHSQMNLWWRKRRYAEP
jgi:hypothetical protein